MVCGLILCNWKLWTFLFRNRWIGDIYAYILHWNVLKNVLKQSSAVIENTTFNQFKTFFFLPQICFEFMRALYITLFLCIMSSYRCSVQMLLMLHSINEKKIKLSCSFVMKNCIVSHCVFYYSLKGIYLLVIEPLSSINIVVKHSVEECVQVGIYIVLSFLCKNYQVKT